MEMEMKTQNGNVNRRKANSLCIPQLTTKRTRHRYLWSHFFLFSRMQRNLLDFFGGLNFQVSIIVGARYNENMFAYRKGNILFFKVFRFARYKVLQS